MENDFKYTEPTDNHFLSRGCCHAPQIYQDNSKIAEHRCCKLDATDWLKELELPEGQEPFDCIEVRFKNSRKEFYKVTPDMKFQSGDIVAVEASPGHDIGIVSLTGEVVKLQMKRKNVDFGSDQIKKVYRKARLSDIEKWLNAVDLEDRAQFKTRKIAHELGLAMKINDVEYQGDETKAIFYYTADERVDFRELIKMLAEEFKVRIEMRQIGARQESARLGGIGSCGREVCCATWLSDFTSVTTNTARIQQLSLNPQKLAGQCGKLKCCLNYENDVYLDALKDFPNTNILLKTEKGDASHQKSDVFKRIMWYAYVNDYSNMMALTVDRVLEIIEDNKKGILPKQLEDIAITREIKTDTGSGSLTEEDIHRFDQMEEPGSDTSRKKKKPKRKPLGSNPAVAQERPNQRDQRPQQNRNQENRENPDNRRQDNRPRPDNKPKQDNRPRQEDRNKPENKSNPDNRGSKDNANRRNQQPRSEGNQRRGNPRNQNNRNNNNPRKPNPNPGNGGENKPREGGDDNNQKPAE